jgi:hypothetical protein
MGIRMVGRIIGLMLVAASAGALAAGAAVAAPGCTDSWTNPSGGAWDTGANWSAGHAPGPGGSACIMQPGAGASVGNESITVANLTIGPSSSLEIGNGGPVGGGFTVTGRVTNDGTISPSWGIGFSAGTLVNDGTFDMPFDSGLALYLSFGNVVNAGTFSAEDPTYLTLRNGGTFANTGTISAGPISGSLTISSHHPGAGTVELEPGGVVDMVSHTITVADDLDITGGSVCGAPLAISSGDGATGETLAFAGASGAGGCPAGVVADTFAVPAGPAVLSGTIPAGDTVTAGSGGESVGATLALSGDVVNDGTLELAGALLTGVPTATGMLTNRGRVVVPSGADAGDDIGLRNAGTLEIDGSLGVGPDLPDVPETPGWTNGARGTIIVGAGGSLGVSSSFSALDGTFTQEGTIDNAGTLDVDVPIVLDGGAICGDPLQATDPDGTSFDVTLTFTGSPAQGPGCPAGSASDQVVTFTTVSKLIGDIPSGWTVSLGGDTPGIDAVSTPGPLVNDGTLVPEYGVELDVAGAFVNRGSVSVPTSPDAWDVSRIAATKTVNDGTLTVIGKLAVANALRNQGMLSLASGTWLSVDGDFTQAPNGTLLEPTEAAGAARFLVSGPAFLAGTAELQGATDPPAGTQVPVLTDSGTSGTFTTVTGPFSLSYSPTGVTATSDGSSG